MYATEQTESAKPAHHFIIDLGPEGYGVPATKHLLPMEIVTVMPSYRERGDPGARAMAKDSCRIQGGNWCMQAFAFDPHIHQERRRPCD